MGKTLLNRFGKGAVLGAALAGIVSLASCGFPGNNNPDPNKNYAPKVSELTANPNPAQVNSTVRLNLTGTDIDGPSDIAEYKIGEDKNNDNELEDNELLTIPSSSPIKYDAKFDTIGNKKIIGQVTDYHGMTDKKTIDVFVTEPGITYVTIKGDFQDNETHKDQFGEVRLYVNGNEDTTQKDTDGEDFTFLVPSGSNVKLEGMIEDASGAPKSYVRTQNLSNITSDQTGVLVRAVPYPAPTDGFDATQFYSFMNEINLTNGLHKWDLSKLNGIEILASNPHPDSPGSLDSVHQGYILNKISNLNNIRKFVKGYSLGDYVQMDNADNTAPNGKIIHYGPNFNNKNGIDDGWIIVAPNNNITGGNGQTTFTPDDTNITKKAWIDLNTAVVTNPLSSDGSPSPIDSPVVSHEFGIAFIAQNSESNTIPSKYTILGNTNQVLTTPGTADAKAAKIIYEDTYTAGEPIDNILGTTF